MGEARKSLWHEGWRLLVRVHSRRAWTVCLVLAVLIPLSPAVAPPALAVQEIRLLQAAGAPDRGHLPRPSKPWIARRQWVEINAAAFDSLDRDRGPAPPRVVMDLFEQSIVMEFEGVGDRSARERIWRGHPQGDPEGDATVVVRDGICVGTLTVFGRHFKLEYAGNGQHELVELNDRAFPPDHHPVAVGEGFTGSVLAAPTTPDGFAAGDDGTVVDILVAYTPAAKAAEGGQAAIEALAILGVDTANQAYANSLINLRLRLVQTVEVAYAESRLLSTDLSRLRNKTDGFMDNLHALRDQAKADLVALITASGDGCGIAYVMIGGPQPSFESSAFSVTVRDCVPNMTLAHETGHNMGNAHDRANSSVGVYPYSFGYQDVVGGYRTVMAYPCTTGSCPRIRYFSNPQVTYNGRPIGIDYDTMPSTAADNARSMNNVRTTVANWRVSGAPVDTTAPSAPRNLRPVP